MSSEGKRESLTGLPGVALQSLGPGLRPQGQEGPAWAELGGYFYQPSLPSARRALCSIPKLGHLMAIERV